MATSADPRYDWFKGEHGRRAIDHVFMPRRLPEDSDEFEDINPELCLYAMSDCINDLPNNFSQNCVPLTEQMLGLWADVQRSSLDFLKIKDVLENRKPDKQLALYLTGQNATIIIRRQDGQVKLWAFDVHAKTALVTEAPQALYGVFPRAAVVASPDVILTTDFAHQLVQLHSFHFKDAQSVSSKHGVEVVETRDAINPKYVFEWLLSAVGTEVDQTAPRVEKKVRDTVVYTKGELPWRRSGIFLSLKWVMHASLVAELGHVRGTCIYKACMLKFACHLAVEQHLNVDLDLRQQMLSKCARKLSKLELLLEKESSVLTDSLLKQTCLEITKAAHETLSVLQETSKNLWREYEETWQKERDWVLEPRSLDFQKDTKQQLPESKDVLLELIKREASNDHVAVERAVITYSNNWYNPHNRLWILHHEEEDTFHRFMTSTIDSDVESLFDALKVYIKDADSVYNDPYGWGRKILCIYCKVAMIDTLLCQEFPILKEHCSDVDPDHLRHLVLVDSKLLQVLAKVESYFMNRKQSAYVKYPGPLEADVSPVSLAVRFAAHSSSMEQTRQKILDESAKQEQAKREEIRRGKEYVKELREKAYASQHEYRREYNCRREAYENVHVYKCIRCSYENRINSYSLDLYEHLLPNRVDFQRAIVFELTSPKIVNLWLDAILLANQAAQFYRLKETEIRQYWLTCPTLSKWSTTNSRQVQLVSSVKSFLQTHYRSRIVDTACENDFIVENASNCVYRYEFITEEGQGKVQKNCTYVLEKEAYKPLQSYMGFTHQESQVLVMQYRCSQAMKLPEFVAFGCARAGQRLQWHNLYAALHQRTLTFGEKDVMQLVCQAAWQACDATDVVPLAELKWTRNVHAILSAESEFVHAFLEELESFLKTFEKNWQNHWALGAVVVLAVRIFDVVGTVNKQEECRAEGGLGFIVNFLRRCRSLGAAWLQTIETIVKDKMDLDDLASLRRRLVEIASFIALSYNTSPALVPELLANQEDILHWLRAVICICDNTVLVNDRIPGFSGSLLQLVQRLAFQLKDRLAELSSPEVLEECVKNYYAAGDVLPETFSLVTINALWAQFRWTEKTAARGVMGTVPALIQINLLQGDFWVNGSPLSRLGKEITSQPTYARLFEDTVFDVVSCTDAFGVPALRTKYDYSGSRFIFTRDRIDEERKDGQVLHLIPDKYFVHDLPKSFSRDYSHWLCTSTQKLYFREKTFRHPKFADLTLADFVLNCADFTLTNKENQCLVDVYSPTFKKMADLFGRIELRHFLHIWHQRDAGQLPLVQLTRHGLEFHVCPHTGTVSSVEHAGWVVRDKQRLGTLFGLRNVLVLEERGGVARQMALVPHGKLELFNDALSRCHHGLRINLSEIESPSYFKYKVDSKLRCLTGPANQTAWLYLAALHAGTSSVLRDDFSGMTGVEMAFNILQSPRCWSGRPYDAVAYKILEFVGSLSPQRNYYPEHLKAMEQVKFPSVIPSLCAHEGYYFIAQKLVNDSERLRFLHGEQQTVKKVASGHDLKVKYYYDTLANYSPLAHLNAEFKPVSRALGKCFAYPQVWEENSTVRYVANAVRQNVVLKFEFTEESTWSSLVGTSDSRYAPKKLDELSGEWSKHSYAYWSTISVPDMFFALDKHVREIWGAVSHRSLFLSFLTYTNPAKTGLVAALTVATHSGTTERSSTSLVPPSLQSYCVRKPQLGSANFYEINSFDAYCRSSCLDIDRMSTSTLKVQEASYNRKVSEAIQSIDDFVNRQKSRLEICDVSSSTATEFYVNETLTADRCIVKVEQLNANIKKAFGEAHQYRVLRAYCAAISERRQQLLPIPNLSLPTLRDHSRPSLRLESERPILKFSLKLPDRDQQYILEENQKKDVLDLMEELNTSDSWNEHVAQCLPLSVSGEDPVSHAFLENLKASYANLKPKRGEVPISGEQIRRNRTVHVSNLKKFLCILESRYTESLQCPGTKSLHASELTLPCVPLVFLPRLLQQDCGDLYTVIAAIATLWTKVQKCDRLLHYLEQGNSNAFQRELSQGLHRNWDVVAQPEWLLFELENDVSIWPVQVAVAEKMMHPEGNRHSVLQLNMGEGKTSVITPMIAAKLAHGEQLARIIVLNSLFSTNLDELVLKLGGLLSKRIYTFPCRRDVRMGVEDGRRILDVLEECKRLGGVILTVPEHVLSLQLKYFETCIKGNLALAGILGNILSFVHENVRDVIDEADEVLHHKYQLIYTLGAQVLPDGGQYRFLVAQICFHGVKRHLSALEKKFRRNTVECVHREAPQAFPLMRFLESSELVDAYQWLCERILEDFLAGTTGFDIPWRSLPPRQEKIIRQFIQTRDLDEELLRSFKELGLTSEMEAMALILRGLLTYDVLLLALKKRWRVEYGVNANGFRAMAVPFRAKDTAAERTEFGHADLAVCLTQLSYYYSGLSNDQIEETLDRLMGLETRENIYASWVSATVPELLDPSIRELGGVNRADSTQIKLHIYPFLRYHMQCIDFFLSRIVFSKELKQFPSKIVATAWDLCPQKRPKPVTGFSGTNDTQYLLPYFIRQNDLPELLGTNAQVCSYILQAENNYYKGLPPSCTGSDLLDRLAASTRISVLIDAGALILELSNREVAQKWLKLRLDMKAAVYFNHSNQLCVLDRRGHDAKLRLSPYGDNLDKCLVYLDDVHTRGTDLKLPAGTQAAVTLGKGLRKDKFVQACMRLRQLGSTHSLAFWASAEVNVQIQAAAGQEGRVTSKHVLEWCIRNSIQATREGFLSWAWQGASHLRLQEVVAQSASAEPFPASAQAIAHVGKNCADKDQRTLVESFAQVRSLETVAAIVSGWANHVAHVAILAVTCAKYVPGVKRYAHILDEQQERELEHELEEERMIQRPPPAQALPETLTPGLKELIQGTVPSTGEHILPLLGALQQTSLYTEECKPFFRAWDPRLLCSKTFAHVVSVSETSSGRNSSHDEFLRALRWIIVLSDGCSEFACVVAISPFEADKILRYMRSHGHDRRVSVRPFSVRRKLGETSLVFDDRLTLNPSFTRSVCWNEHPNLYTELSIFAGEQFFGDGKEVCTNQALVCLFLGLCPMPHNEEEQTAFDEGIISQDMFLRADRRNIVDSKFCTSPVKWVIDLYGLRGLLAELNGSHMGRILLSGGLPAREGKKLLTVGYSGRLQLYNRIL